MKRKDWILGKSVKSKGCIPSLIVFLVANGGVLHAALSQKRGRSMLIFSLEHLYTELICLHSLNDLLTLAK